MSLSPPELELVGRELQQELAGARVQKIYVPEGRRVVFDLRLPGRSVLLLLEAEAESGRAGAVSSRPESPPRPFAFQGLLRAHLQGARLEEVRVHSLERVVRLCFATVSGLREVVLEIHSKGGNIHLLSSHGAILGSVLLDASNGRGAPWRMPSAGPAGGRVRFTPETGQTHFPVSRAIEDLYAGAGEDRALRSARAALFPPLRAFIKRTARTVEKVRAERDRADEAERYRRYGDLLKTSLHSVAKGAGEARLVEYSEDGVLEVTVPLQARLSPRENMERYYHLHRRLTRNLELIDRRLNELERKVGEARRLLDEVEHAEDVHSVEALASRAVAEGFTGTEASPRDRSGRAVEGPRLPYREYRSASGRPIRVGRGARDNDALTFKHARGNDLWLHARGRTGSHVIVPGVGAEGADQETLLDAATLAAHFSSARGEAVCEVAVTRRKHVRKPRDAPPGSVQFSQEKTITLRVEGARIDRLLATLGGGS